MIEITADIILKVCNGTLLTNNKNCFITNFSTNTKALQSGEMFIAIKGENVDGNDYLEDALNKGAIGAIVDKTPSINLLNKYSNSCIIKVNNTITAIQELAKYKREKSNIPVVAITGSVGKTSTKDLVSSVLSQKFKVLKTEGNFNNHIGLPLTFLRLTDHEVAVIEMGMNHFGELRTLTNIAKPNVCIITNIGTSHIGNLGSRENILKAKLEILDGLQANGSIIINNDNDLLHEWNNKENLKNIITYGIDNLSTYTAKNINLFENYSKYFIEKAEVTVPVPGMPFVYNSLCAYAIGKLFNVEDTNITKGIAEFKLTSKRMDIVKLPHEITIINDSYNASFDSVKAALEILQNIKGTRKIAVLGDMLELGEFSKEIHENVGLEVLKNNIDVLITVGNYAKYISDVVNTSNIHTFICSNNDDAYNKIRSIIKAGDVLLFKASHSMNFNQIVEQLLEVLNV